MYREVCIHRGGHYAQEQSRNLVAGTKSGLSCILGLSYCFGPRGTMWGGGCKYGRRSRPGAGQGGGSWNEALRLHPSNSQAYEVENKVKCTNQSLGPLFSDTLKNNSFLEGNQGNQVCTGPSIWSLEMWVNSVPEGTEPHYSEC